MFRYVPGLILILAIVGIGVKMTHSGGSPMAVQGHVVFKGTPPAAKVVEVTQDREVCGRTNSIQRVEVQGDGLKNAVVKLVGVKNATAEPTFPEAVLIQKGCSYHPHVLLMAPGQLTITNSDGILHNVHLYPKVNQPQNKAMPRFLRKIKITIDKPDIISVRCDVHGWMSAVIVVAEHPFYALTDSLGNFRIENVPAGEYTVEVWHETLGELSGTVKVQSRREARVELIYSPK
ncbi:MAG: carboxypeptidase regulatory-like domain-containing protein [bacterium]